MKEDITIKEFKQKKYELEAILLALISKEVKRFEEETGYSPSAIEVETVDASTFNQEGETHVITDVTVKVDL